MMPHSLQPARRVVRWSPSDLRRRCSLPSHVRPGQPDHNRGYTLIELLIVVMIVIILLAIALPVAKRVMEDSRTREASRQLTTHFSMARAYAARYNRPFGIWMEYDQPIGAAADVRQVTRIYLAETQPPFAGGTTSARGIIRIEPGETLPEFLPLTGLDQGPSGTPDGRIDQDDSELALLLSLLDEGEAFLVRFDFKGDWFRCFRGSSTLPAPINNPNKLYYRNGIPPSPINGSVSGTTAPPAYDIDTSPGYRYQILRTPRRVGQPLELTGGTCIDVEYSGIGQGGFDFGVPSNRLVVVFSPNGGIDGLFTEGPAVTAPGTLHFLVGRVEKVNQPLGTNAGHPTGLNMFDLATSNLVDPTSIWVSVGRQNGTATSTENVIPPVDGTTLTATSMTIFPAEPLPTDTPPGRRQTIDPSTPAGRAIFVGYCRAAATGREQMGGQ